MIGFFSSIRKSIQRAFLLVLTALSPPLVASEYCCPSGSFSGFNVSGNIGLNVPCITSKGDLIVSIPGVQLTSFEVAREASNTAFIGGARAGYNFVYNQCFLIGLAFDANFTKNHMEFKGDVNEQNTSLSIPVQNDITLKDQYAVLLKFGQLIGSRSLLYGLVGAQWGRFDVFAETSFFQDLGVAIEAGPLVVNRKSWRTGVLVGVGSEVLLTSCLSLALEYTHSFYGRYALPTETTVTIDGVPHIGSSLTLENQYSINVHNFMLRLGYYY